MNICGEMNTRIRINGNKNIKHNTIKARLGLTDKNNHNTFYLEGGAFIKPQSDYDDFPYIMSQIESVCRKNIKRKLLHSPILSPDFLMNFEICSDRMQCNKKSYLSFQYHFKQRNTLNNSVLDIKDEYETFFISLLNDIEKELLSYDIVANKKRN